MTPTGLRWAVEEGQDGTWSLALDLDDSELPLPYVIDPAIAARTPASSANTGGGANTITITKPAGLVAGDLMLAQITTRGGTNVAICPPTATGPGRRSTAATATTTLGQEIFRLSATAADVAATNYAFQFRTTTCSAAVSDGAEGERRHRRVRRHRQPGQSGRRSSRPVNFALGEHGHAAGRHADGRQHARSRLLRRCNGGTIGTNWTGVDGRAVGSVLDRRHRRVAHDVARADEAEAGDGGTVHTVDRRLRPPNAVNIGQTLALAPLAADGSGTLTTPTTNVAAGSTGNTLTFTYTAATGGMRNGSVTLVVPTGWSAPSTTGTAAGYTTSSTGTVGVAGQTITVSGVTLTATSTLTVGTASTGGSGPGATATATTGAQTWQAQQRSSSVSGALANLGGVAERHRQRRGRLGHA